MKGHAAMNEETDKDIILKEEQTAIAPPPVLDPDRYREHLKEFELTKDQQDELLAALWHIMRTFVDIGFGLESVQLFSGASDDKASRNALDSSEKEAEHDEPNS